MAFLTRLFARRGFPLPQFDLAPLAFDVRPPDEDELSLDRRLPLDDNSNVIALPGAPQTPGELHESIERHLRDGRGHGPQRLEQDAVGELREALADLRRSLA
jgi:hypothetical protein